MTALRAGMKVVVVDDSYTAGGTDFEWPAGAVVTVSEVCLNQRGIPFVKIEGQRYGYSMWRPDRFRPVKTTSIECFKALLAPVPKKQKERV
jgi:hypothetical protein